MELGPAEVGPWHSHSEVTDHIFGLTGGIAIRLQDPSEEIVIGPGDHCTIPPARVHQVSNLNRQRATYLLVQGVGKYDFNTVA
jgi:mannose-6-phosphate isomerase-like protein (cupin superfamily)